MLIKQKWGKPIKVLKCKHRFCLNCLAACFLSGKNEEESQCPACKMNTLKIDITLVLHLICQLCCYCLKCNATYVVKCSPRYNPSLEKTHTKLFIKHLTIHLTFGYHHRCPITSAKKENKIKSKKIFD